MLLEKKIFKSKWIISGCLSNQYSIAINPNSCDKLAYKLVTLKDTSFEFFVKFFLHFWRKLKSSFTKLLILDKRGLRRISQNY